MRQFFLTALTFAKNFATRIRPHTCSHPCYGFRASSETLGEHKVEHRGRRSSSSGQPSSTKKRFVHKFFFSEFLAFLQPDLGQRTIFLCFEHMICGAANRIIFHLQHQRNTMQTTLASRTVTILNTQETQNVRDTVASFCVFVSVCVYSVHL